MRQSSRTSPVISFASHLGLIAHRRGRHAAAARLIEQALGIKPDYVEAVSNLAAIRRTLGDTEAAITAAGDRFDAGRSGALALPSVGCGFYNAQVRKRNTAMKNPAAKIVDSATSAPGAKLKTPPKKIPGRATKPQGARQMPPDTAKVVEIFRRFEAANPHPKSELDYVNAFTLLVAVVLSAQATDFGVNKVTSALFAVAGSPAKMAALGEEKLQDMIKTIGLYRSKAKNLVALSQRLVKNFGGEVPQGREALETLPGVGRKTANVVMNIAFGAPAIAVDTHIFRVSNRIPLAAGKTPLEVERGLEKIIPGSFKHHAHHWLILHGRYICKARRPECERCLISDLCRWPGKRA